VSCKSHVIRFGKHKGKTIDQIAKTDAGLRYLDWMVGLPDLREDTKAALEEYLKRPSVSREIDRILGGG
jgi:exodeoxyribonuclease X